jgi:signal transduction histidine kinase/CheY-like chemotaxis protein
LDDALQTARAAAPGDRRPSGARRSDSVRTKLLTVVLVTTGTALLLAAAAMLVYDVRAHRATFVDALRTQAGILALSAAPALGFDDRESAARSLESLRAGPAVGAAALYVDGRRYASYARPGEAPLPETLGALQPGTYVEGGKVTVLLPVEHNGEQLGFVQLRGRDEVRTRVRTYLSILGFVLVLAMGAAVLLSRRLHASITQPLEAMAGVARDVVEQRDFSLRAPNRTDDEIGLVVDAFNAMLDEIETRTAALRDADRRKDEFLATLAHELRNPLAPIRHAAKLLDSPNAEARHVHWARDVIARQVTRMALLLDDLLDVSRITRGLLALKTKPVSLGTVISAAVETAQPLIDAKHHLLTVRLPSTDVTLNADPLRLSQAVSNLLTNAAKYTDAGGRIELGVTVDGNGLAIAVADTGIGLDPSAVPKLFEMFSQVDAAHERTEGGLGIGLALVRGLVELHGGSVRVESPGLGRGSTFTIALPASVLLPGAVIVRDPAAVAAVGTHPRTVVVADDNRDAADALATVLRLSGHDVHVAYGGHEALTLADRVRPDALILDLGMPDLDGHELARAVRRREWGAGALLLAVTGWGQEVDRQRSRAAGFDHHLTKPVDSEDVLRLIAGAWTRDRATAP